MRFATLISLSESDMYVYARGDKNLLGKEGDFILYVYCVGGKKQLLINLTGRCILLKMEIRLFSSYFTCI